MSLFKPVHKKSLVESLKKLRESSEYYDGYGDPLGEAVSTLLDKFASQIGSKVIDVGAKWNVDDLGHAIFLGSMPGGSGDEAVWAGVAANEGFQFYVNTEDGQFEQLDKVFPPLEQRPVDGETDWNKIGSKTYQAFFRLVQPTLNRLKDAVSKYKSNDFNKVFES